MKTPKYYQKNLKQKIITEEMLSDCLYSANKRAKNMRDNKNEDRGMYDTYNNFEKYVEKEQLYYSYKETLLSLVTPILIHEQTSEYTYKYFFSDEYVHYPVEGEDYEYITDSNYLYFLYYEVGTRSFHTPIGKFDEKQKFEERNLQIKSIDSNFYTYGADVSDLLSVQFVKKVVELIKSGDFTYVKNEDSVCA